MPLRGAEVFANPNPNLSNVLYRDHLVHCPSRSNVDIDSGQCHGGIECSSARHQNLVREVAAWGGCPKQVGLSLFLLFVSYSSRLSVPNQTHSITTRQDTASIVRLQLHYEPYYPFNSTHPKSRSRSVPLAPIAVDF